MVEDQNITGFTLTDGGRAAAGFEGTAGDCVTRAIAVMTGEGNYAAIHGELTDRKRVRLTPAKARTRRYKRGADAGANSKDYDPMLEAAGFTQAFRAKPRQHRMDIHTAYAKFGDGIAIVVRAGKSRKQGGHAFAIKGGRIHDRWDCRKVDFGVVAYWQAPKSNVV